jgi:hypothetical protein
LISGSRPILSSPNDAAPAATREETKVNDQSGRCTRLRNIAIGALAALAVVGAIAGTAALAAKPHAGSGKAHAAQAGSSQPFLADVQRLVNDGTISRTQGQAVNRQILAGRLDTQTLASSGFTQSQLQAVEQALTSTKRALASSSPKASPGSKPAAPARGSKPPPPAGSAKAHAAQSGPNQCS